MDDTLTLISEMHKFHFGSKVFCTDGEEGTLTHIGFDPTSRRLSSIGVRQGRLFGKNVFLPAEVVVSASGDGVTLNISREELAKAGKTVDGVVYDNKSVVQTTTGSAKGTLLLVAIHPQDRTLEYIVAHHLRPNQSTLLHNQYVSKLEVDVIVVSISEATLQTLPPYRPDSELQQEVEEILFDLTPLHVDFKGMQVKVLDSVLYLDGNISSSLRADIVQDQALGVQGLLEIKNRLVGDDQLSADLAMALANDERTRRLPIGVYPRLGDVRLSGAVHNAEQKAAAEEIARRYPGVKGVTNDLIIDPNLDMLRVMSSAEGGEAADKVPGRYIRHTR